MFRIGLHLQHRLCEHDNQEPQLSGYRRDLFEENDVAVTSDVSVGEIACIVGLRVYGSSGKSTPSEVYASGTSSRQPADRPRVVSIPTQSIVCFNYD